MEAQRGIFSHHFLSRGSAGEVRGGASFPDNPSILAGVSGGYVLNYLSLSVPVPSRLPGAYFKACVCVYIQSVVYKRLTGIPFV